MPKVVIDGIEIEVPPGTTILNAAQRVGVEIPVFCYHPYLKPAGICRMCLVEVKGLPRLMPACVTEVQDGWEIYTDSERVKDAREWLLEFVLVNHPLECPICDEAGECELQNFVFKFGEPRKRLYDEPFKHPTKYLGPLIVHQMNRCVLCRRCVRFGDEVMGGTDWGVYERGYKTIVGPYESDLFAQKYTFNMEALCPVGAITSNVYRYKTRIWKLDFTDSVCAHCEVGCWLDLGERNSQLLKVLHKRSYPSPWICDRGGYGFEYVNHSERITVPLRREGNRMRGVSTDEALDYVVGGLKEVVEGGGKVAALVSPHLTCEDYLLMGRFMKEVVGSEYMDYRLYGGNTYPERPSIDSLDDVEKAQAYLVVGEDLSIHHPVLALSVAKGAKEGEAPLYLVVTGDSFLFKFAALQANPLPGAEEKVLEALVGALEGEDYASLLESTGVSGDVVKDMAQGLQDKKPLLIGGNRLTPRGRVLLRALGEKLGVTPLFLDWGSNSKGAFQMGFWSPGGESVEDILNKCVSGEIKGLFVSSMDLFRDYPNGVLVKEALSNLDFLAVHDMFFTETVAYSDCYLPAVSFAEDGGTVVNMFWEAQKRNKSFDPRDESMPLWKVAMGLAQKWGKPLGDYSSVEDVTPLVKERLSQAVEAPAVSGGIKEEDLKGDIPALFEYPFYKSGVKADFCNAFVQLAPEPYVVVNPEFADQLGFKDGDIVIMEVDGYQFRMKLFLGDEVPPGGAMVSRGFSDFPVTRALKGLWYRGIELRAAKE